MLCSCDCVLVMQGNEVAVETILELVVVDFVVGDFAAFGLESQFLFQALLLRSRQGCGCWGNLSFVHS